MRNLAFVFCLGTLAMSAMVACGDDSSSATQALVESSASVTSSSSLNAEGDSPAEGSSAAVSSSSATSSATSSETAKGSSSSVKPGSSAGPAASSESAAPSSAESATSSESAPASSDAQGDDGKCTACDSYTAADPELTENGGKGSVTTYGSITEKETSLGGACNYGQTNIQYYAAIHVNVSPGDDKGPWDGGAACGACVRVKAKTPEGWKTVTVRITDRCPDANCGVDLGGAPAADIMGNQVGRYYGEWEFVSCEGVEGVWGDSTSLWVKEGASEYWSIIQVRNPKDRVDTIGIYGVDTRDYYILEMVEGTENFWTVPKEVLQTDNRYRVVVKYRTGADDEWHIKGPDLAVPEANLYLYEYRK